MNTNAMFKIQYGLFVLTAREGEKDNGCIINTASQVTSTPCQISIAVNKDNYTHDMIQRTKEFNVSVIAENATFDLFQHFGFQSGKTVDKFQNYANAKRSENGIYYVNSGSTWEYFGDFYKYNGTENDNVAGYYGILFWRYIK